MDYSAQILDKLINFAVVFPRLAAAFLVLPLITQESMPSMLRNVFIISIALVVYPYITYNPTALSFNPLILSSVIFKELFIGLIIGFSFSVIFWALEAAGQIIDNKIGTTTAQIVDPLSGHQTSLNGKFLSYLCGFVFVSFGGLLVFIELILHSYSLWPIDKFLPDINQLGKLFFIDKFAELLSLSLLLSAPVLLVLTLVEFGLGLVNRYARQLNIFALSLSIKAWLGSFILVLMLTTVIQFIVNWIEQQDALLSSLSQVLR